MQKSIKIKMLIILAVVEISFSGCRIRQRTDMDEHYPRLKAQEFQGEIARIEAALPKTTDSIKKANFCLRLAMMHLSPDNPAPDYAASLKYLDLYATIDPVGGARDENRRLMAVLRVLKKAIDENRSMKTRIEHLSQENREVKSALEQLKSLDMEMERRRKEVK